MKKPHLFCSPKPELIPETRKDRTLAKQGKAHCVTFPVSYRYNGMIEVNGQNYDGYDVPRPDVPAGFKLVSLGCGLQFNARPPHATMKLVPIDPA